MVGRRNPWPRLFQKWLQTFVRILHCHVKHDEMSSFCLNNGFRLQENKQGCKTLKKKPFHRVSRDKILHDSWSISAALTRGFSNPPFCTRRRPWGRGWESTTFRKLVGVLAPLSCRDTQGKLLLIVNFLRFVIVKNT